MEISEKNLKIFISFSSEEMWSNVVYHMTIAFINVPQNNLGFDETSSLKSPSPIELSSSNVTI